MARSSRQEDEDLPRPTAARLRRPSWRDSRLVIGVVLVLGAIVGGAASLQHLNSTVDRLAAAHPLVPGQHVTRSDFTVVHVRVPDGERHYLAADAEVPDGVVLRVVRSGELVPTSAIGDPASLHRKTIALPVTSSQSDALVAGSVVDVWVSRKDRSSTRADAYKDPKRLIERATVARVPTSRHSGLSVSTGAASVHVLVPDDEVAEVLAAVNGGAKVDLVPSAGSPVKAAS